MEELVAAKVEKDQKAKEKQEEEEKKKAALSFTRVLSFP